MIHKLRSLQHLKPKTHWFSRSHGNDGHTKPGFLSRKLGLIKHFWKILITDMLLWAMLAGVIFFVSPESQLGVEFFFGLLFLALVLLIFLITVHKRRSVLITIAVVGLILLRFYKLDTWINLVMLLGLSLTIELLFLVD